MKSLFAEVDNKTGALVRYISAESGWTAPEHKVGPAAPTSVVPVVDIPSTDYELDPKTEHLESEAALVNGTWLRGYVVVANPPVSEVPRWAFRAVVALAGLMPTIDTALLGLPEPAKTVAKEQWAGVGVIRRQHPTVLQLLSLTGVTPTQADSLFKQANELALTNNEGI